MYDRRKEGGEGEKAQEEREECLLLSPKFLSHFPESPLFPFRRLPQYHAGYHLSLLFGLIADTFGVSGVPVVYDKEFFIVTICKG